MKKSISTIDEKTGERVTTIVKMTPEETAQIEATRADVEAPESNPLTRAQWEWLLDVSGLDDVVAAIVAGAKERDRVEYAALRKTLNSSRFQFPVVLALLQQYHAAIPKGGAVTEATLAGLWKQAKAQ